MKEQAAPEEQDKIIDLLLVDIGAFYTTSRRKAAQRWQFQYIGKSLYSLYEAKRRVLGKIATGNYDNNSAFWKYIF